MKKLICLCFLAVISTQIWAQRQFENLEDYMRNVYSLNEEQIAQFANVRNLFLDELNLKKSKVMSSAEYKKECRILYDQYYANVKLFFTSDQYTKWTSCIERLDRYRELGEIKFIEREKILRLYEAESKWNEQRITIRNMDIPGQTKLENLEQLRIEFNLQIDEILGSELGHWFRTNKEAHLRALGNMDKYQISYNNAYDMAIIENDYHKQKQAIHYSQRKNNEKEELLLSLDDAEYYELETKIGQSIASRWKEINDNKLNYSLRTEYGLSSAQISKYKDAYNTYLISEHMIVYEQRNLSPEDKRELLVSANNKFCDTVAKLIPTEKYSQWEAYRLFQFNKKLDRKITK